MCMGFIGLGEVRVVEAPEVSKPDFTGVLSLELPHPLSEAGVWNWALVAEVDRVAHRVLAPPQVPHQYRLLCFLSTLGTCSHPSYHNPTGLFQTEP
jgi:hypothetical protein